MIINEDDYDDRKEEAETSATPIVQPDGSILGPPSYSEISAGGGQADTQLGYGTFNTPKERKSKKGWKVLKAVLISWGTWALTLCLIQSVIALSKYVERELNQPVNGDKRPPRHKRPSAGGDGRISVPQCVKAVQLSSNHTMLRGVIVHDEDKPFSAAVNFSIPTTIDSLSFFSNGSERDVFGFIHFVESEDPSPDILVDVTISYTDEANRVVDNVNICLFEDDSNERGIGILLPPTPSAPNHTNHLHFDINVQLPTPPYGPPLFIKSLRTDFSMFHHRFGDFFGKVEFGSVSLKTSSMPMYISGLTADYARVTSTNGLISGIFNVTSGLELITENSPISAIITMNNNDSTKDVKAVLRTSNRSVSFCVSPSLFVDVARALAVPLTQS